MCLQQYNVSESLAVIYPNLGDPKRNLPKLRQKKVVYIMTGLKYYNVFKNSTFYGPTVALAFSIKHCYPNFKFKVLFRLVFNM